MISNDNFNSNLLLLEIEYRTRAITNHHKSISQSNENSSSSIFTCFTYYIKSEFIKSKKQKQKKP